MKKYVLLLSTAAIGLPAMAQEAESIATVPSKKHHFSVGLEAVDWHYEEEYNSKKVMSDSGVLYGPSFGYRYLFDQSNQSNLYFELNGRYVKGNTEYDGHLQNTRTGQIVGTYQTKTKNSISEFSSLFAREYFVSARYSYTPFIGLNYRLLHNESIDQYGYDREATYLTAPIGVRGDWKFDNMSFGIAPEVHLPLMAQTVSDHTAKGGNKKTFVQKNGFSFALRTHFTYQLKNNSSVSFKPSYQIWLFPDSEPVYNGNGLYSIEPKNVTQMIGANLSYNF